MHTKLTARLAAVAAAAGIALAGLAIAAPASAAPSAAPIPCPTQVVGASGGQLRLASFTGLDCTYRYPAPSSARVCEFKVLGETVELHLLSYSSRECKYGYKTLTPEQPGVEEAPVVVAPAPVTPASLVDEAPASDVTPEPEVQQAVAEEAVVAPAPVAASPVTPTTPAIEGVLAVKYAQFASTYPGTSAYSGAGNCVARNFGFVQNGTFAPSFTYGNGVSAQVMLVVNTARSGYDVQWYGCF